MSTGSSIAVKKDGKVKIIYCHFDGYHSHVGKMLLNYYNNQKKADAIIALGDMSCLYKSIECPPGHSYDNRMHGLSVFYGRDRGESRTAAVEFKTYKKALAYNHQEYNYFWNGERWACGNRVLSKIKACQDI